MRSFEEARDTILSNVAMLEAVQVELLDSLGRVIAEDVIAPLNLPSFDNSAMDGYAVRTADCNGPAPLPIIGYIPAGGTATTEATPGSAIKIMTGAPLPLGCDAIVPFEDAEEFDNKVMIQVAPLPGQHIRRAGEDVKRGEKVIVAGTLVRVPEISMLASLGRTLIQVYRKPVPGNPVSAIITFEELVRPALLKMMGHRRVLKRPVTATLQESLRKKAGRIFFARVRLEHVDGKYLAWSAGLQDTGFLKTMLHTDGIAALPADRAWLAAGDEINVHILSNEPRMLEPCLTECELSRQTRAVSTVTNEDRTSALRTMSTQPINDNFTSIIRSVL